MITSYTGEQAAEKAVAALVAVGCPAEGEKVRAVREAFAEPPAKCGPVTFVTNVHPSYHKFTSSVALEANGSWVVIWCSPQEHRTSQAALQAATEAIPALRASMLRDLLSGPEWEGLGETLKHGAMTVAYDQDPEGAALLRALAEELEVGK